jgi:hypothetical protein
MTMNKRSKTEIEAMGSPWGVYRQPDETTNGVFLGAYDAASVDPRSSLPVAVSLKLALDQGLIELQPGTYVVKSLGGHTAPLTQVTVNSTTKPIWTVKRGA